MAMRIKQADLEVEFVKGSGPGGQNRNKRETGVRMRHIPTGIVVRVTEQRTQAENLRIAKLRLAQKIEQHFFVPKKRTKTKPTKASKTRRLATKKKQSDLKAQRQSKKWD